MAGVKDDLGSQSWTLKISHSYSHTSLSLSLSLALFVSSGGMGDITGEVKRNAILGFCPRFMPVARLMSNTFLFLFFK